MSSTQGPSRWRAYAERAASIAATMARHAAARRAGGVADGARAIRALALELAGQARGAVGPCSCPICGWSGARFAPRYDEDYRDNVRCYGCGCTDRCRLVPIYLERALADFFSQERRRVLDIGPLWYSRRFFPEDVEYVSFDLYSKIAMIRGDLCAAPFPDASFDLWLCFHVLDQIADDTAAMRELLRVLRPGGVGLLDNTMDWSAPTREYGAPRPRSGHRRRYGKDLPGRLSSLGFEVEIVDTEAALDAETRRRHGIHGRRFLLCRRPAAS